MIGKIIDISLDYKSKNPKITLVLDKKDNIEKYKDKVLEIKEYKEKRKLDANSYLWVLLQKMAGVLRTTKDELYIEVLGKYGVFTHVIVKGQAVERFKQEYRLVKDLGEVTVNGTTGHQLQCYFGSSTYNSKEFSVLLNGVVEEAEELGVETKKREEIDSILENWGR